MLSELHPYFTRSQLLSFIGEEKAVSTLLTNDGQTISNLICTCELGSLSIQELKVLTKLILPKKPFKMNPDMRGLRIGLRRATERRKEGLDLVEQVCAKRNHDKDEMR